MTTIDQQLFNYMKENHEVDLMESDIQEIKNIILGHESEINKLLTFKRDKYGKLYIKDIISNVHGSVNGNIFGNLNGDVHGDVHAEVFFIKNPKL